MRNIKEWAEKEVEIACLDKETEYDGFDYYGEACKSALIAFNSLLNDGHSGYSILTAKRIINRLIDGKPLSMIHNKENEWYMVTADEKTVYQCTRMPSLFKTIYQDGRVEFNDINRALLVDLDTGDRLDSKESMDLINKYYPITMPYYPDDQPYEIYFKKTENGRKWMYINTPDGKQIDICQLNKEEK